MILFLEHNSLSGTDFVKKCLIYLKNLTGIDISEPQFVYGEYGKPYFKNGDIEFSCSHSRGLSAVLFSKTPCGVDVEKHRAVDFGSLVSKYFKDKDIDNVNDFFDEWCKIEAYSKRLGTSLGVNVSKTPELSKNVPYMKGWSVAVSGDDGEAMIIFDLDILNSSN